MIKNKFRSHTCNELNAEHINHNVTLSGWIHSKRDHGGVIFIDLRDNYGITQLVFNEEREDLLKTISSARDESVITARGNVVHRSNETINSNIPTGEVEIVVEHIIVESAAQVLPFQIADETQKYPEDLRLTYRFLDLRRKKIHNNILLRSQVISTLRTHMIEKGFTEFQTPILTASSPEGARDFLVPSRLHPHKFYALPQAPQQFKQLLMISGFDKYFQIAPCFRDEDARADRSPGEFYQLDVEMSFVEQDDVFSVIEDVLTKTFVKFSNKKITSTPFPRIPFKESMLKYGSDKPDLRIPIEISDVTEIFRDSDFSIFAKNVNDGQVVRAIPVKNISSKPRSFFDNMIKFAQENGAKGLGYINFSEDGTPKGPIAKFLDAERIDKLKSITNTTSGDSIFFSSGPQKDAAKIAGIVRVHLGNILQLIDDDIFSFCWIIDFPYFEYNHDEKKIDFSHNPFSMPQGGMDALETQDPLDILAYQYDIVCNGIELSSGAIRNHKPEIMYKAFSIAGYSKEDVQEKFAGMINALQFGAPPHGGLAPGIDRIVMLLAEEENIREVTSFPMNQQAQDLLMGAPSHVNKKQLEELHISLNPLTGKDSN